MKKEYYIKYINPDEFKKLYEEWAAKGKPKGNNPLYVKVWDMMENSLKACIGDLQDRYHCKYQDYDEKVLDSTILIMNKLINMTDTPKNIVSMCYFTVLNICCSKKAIAQERKNNALSLDSLTEDEYSFCKLMFLDEYGEVYYEYDK